MCQFQSRDWKGSFKKKRKPNLSMRLQDRTAMLEQQLSRRWKQSNTLQPQHYKINTMTSINTHLSIPTFINDLNCPIKRHRLVNWITKQDPFAASMHLTTTGWKERKGCAQANTPRKHAGGAVSDITDCQPKPVRKDKEDHFTLTKGTTHQQDAAKLDRCPEHWHSTFHKTNPM